MELIFAVVFVVLVSVAWTLGIMHLLLLRYGEFRNMGVFTGIIFGSSFVGHTILLIALWDKMPLALMILIGESGVLYLLCSD